FRRVSGATDALFLFSIISKAGLEKSEDFSRPALFLETYVTASLWLSFKVVLLLAITSELNITR
ncbi:hypothetical protein, partial [Lactiplantibacillus plantarum]|uniref:hypothetical protein n=1 Tax=Lactiplantibacillus plantarum TaxID=1590 RepID=UPI001C9E7CC5